MPSTVTPDEAFLASLRQRLRRIDDARALMADAVRLLGEHLRAARVGWAEIDEAQGLVHVAHDWTAGAHLRSLAGTWPLAQFGAGFVRELRAGDAVVLADVAADPRTAGPDVSRAYGAFGIRGMLDVPLVRGGRLVAALYVHDTGPRAWSACEVQTALALCDHLWAVLERARAQDSHAASERLARERLAELETIYRASPVGMAMFDRELRYQRVNDHLAEINGQPADRHIGRTVQEMVPDVDGAAEATLRRVLVTGRPVSGVEVRGSTSAQPGVQREWLLHALPLQGEGDPLVRGVHVVVQEVTEQRRALRELTESQRRLRAADARKDEFLAMMAHELRNPLAPIRNAARMLAMAQEAAPQDAATLLARATGVIERQSAQLARLVDDLLDVSRVATGKVSLQRARHDAVAVVQAGVETARPLLAARQHNLQLDLPPAGQLWLDGDAARLAQVVGNLLSNAAKYTPERGRVSLRLARDGPAQLLVEVSDDGIGIAPEMLGQVFELFVQADVSLERATGGLGVGLALARRLVEMHGGHIEAHSDGLGRGSRFTVRLPALPPEAGEPAAAACASGHGGADAAADARRVLVVDDNVDAGETMAMVLELEGHAARHCASGAEAVALATVERFDAVLLDLGMPGMDGFACARAIRREGASRGALLIAATGYGQPEDRVRTAEAGFDAHLVKPLDLRVLREYLQRLAPVRLVEHIAQRIAHAGLVRFFQAWCDLRPAAGRWPPLAQLLRDTEAFDSRRVVVSVEAGEAALSMRFRSVGAALAELLPGPLVGRQLVGEVVPDGTLDAAYARVARSGEPAHDRADLDFGAGERVRFERVIVPAAESPGDGRPSHLVAMVVFDPAAQSTTPPLAPDTIGGRHA